MTIVKAKPEDKQRWNNFVRANYPPVGAFMQTWEWGNFKEILGQKTERYFLLDDAETISAFTLVELPLKAGFYYGYMPRGPVLVQNLSEDKIILIFDEIKTWIIKEFPHLLFVRLEPPLYSLNADLKKRGFSLPNYYIQPRHNHLVNLNRTEEEILASFHPSTRSNISRAEKRGVTARIENYDPEKIHQDFYLMTKDTIERNNGRQVYPGSDYFSSFFKAIAPLVGERKTDSLCLNNFYGYRDGEPAAIYVVLFFGDTATYLYGASLSAHLNSKVTTYLHWSAMQEAKRQGLKYYDLGGVDDKLWPSLSNFKRQFRGEDLSYIGNIDIPLNPCLYKLYNTVLKFKKTLTN